MARRRRQRKNGGNRCMKSAALALLLAVAATAPATAAELRKSYSYFTISGNTLDDIERGLERRGPNVASTGERHPGATRMEFKTKLGWKQQRNRCTLSSAHVTLTAKIILPRWKPGRKAGSDTRFVWQTLAADIKRHEEAHVIIAKNHAAELEKALMSIGSLRTCEQVTDRAAAVTQRVLDKHEREQQRFDRVESAGFEKRLFKLLEYRLRNALPD